MTENMKMTVVDQQQLDTIDFPNMMNMAATLIKSGFLPIAIKTPAQAVAIMLTGRELGIPAMQALRQINVIQGKPTMAAELMLSLAYQRIPGFKHTLIQSTNEICVCKFERPNHAPYQHQFTIQDAKSLGLDSKDNWKKQPATMLRWRCVSAGLRLIAPDAIAGVYTPEEIIPDGNANFENGTIENPPPPIIAQPQRKSISSENGDIISEAQRKRFYAIYKNAGFTDDQAKDYLLTNYNIEHSNEIKKSDYEEICAWFQNGGGMADEPGANG